MKRLALLAALLTACSPGDFSEVDQCLRTEIFMQCMRLTHGSAGDCEDAAFYQSQRMRKHIREECRS